MPFLNTIVQFFYAPSITHKIKNFRKTASKFGEKIKMLKNLNLLLLSQKKIAT